MRRRAAELRAKFSELDIDALGAQGMKPESRKLHAELLHVLPHNLTAPGIRVVERSETKLKVCKYGLMLYPAREAVGQSLDQFGEWDEEVVEIFRLLLSNAPGAQKLGVVDVGVVVEHMLMGMCMETTASGPPMA